MRNADKSNVFRQTAVSDDGGASWRDQRFDPTLIEPICQASIRRHSWPEGDRPGVIVFSNPANKAKRVPGRHLPEGRANMTVRLSLDDGQTWPFSRELYAGPSAYSCLVTLRDGRIGCLFEIGEKSEKVVLDSFTLGWVKAESSHGRRP
jgi:sialidase-1